MVLDGVEGFPPTRNQNKNVTDSNQDTVQEKLVIRLCVIIFHQ
jgi:hypothetical protein